MHSVRKLHKDMIHQRREKEKDREKNRKKKKRGREGRKKVGTVHWKRRSHTEKRGRKSLEDGERTAQDPCC